MCEVHNISHISCFVYSYWGGLLPKVLSLSTCVLVQHAGHHATRGCGPGPHGWDTSHETPPSSKSRACGLLSLIDLKCTVLSGRGLHWMGK